MNKIMMVVWSVALFCGGVLLGGGYGWHLMDERCGVLVRSVASANDSYYLEKHLAVLQALEFGDIPKAKDIISKLCRSAVKSIQECKADPACSRLVSKQLIADPALQRAMSLK